jgi:hypothetical protein
MIQFLLICPTSALKKIFNPQNMLYINLRLKIISALNLNKFPKNWIIEECRINALPQIRYNQNLWMNLQNNYDLWRAKNSSTTWQLVKPISANLFHLLSV